MSSFQNIFIAGVLLVISSSVSASGCNKNINSDGVKKIKCGLCRKKWYSAAKIECGQDGYTASNVNAKCLRNGEWNFFRNNDKILYAEVCRRESTRSMFADAIANVAGSSDDSSDSTCTGSQCAPEGCESNNGPRGVNRINCNTNNAGLCELGSTYYVADIDCAEGEAYQAYGANVKCGNDGEWIPSRTVLCQKRCSALGNDGLTIDSTVHCADNKLGAQYCHVGSKYSLTDIKCNQGFLKSNIAKLECEINGGAAWKFTDTDDEPLDGGDDKCEGSGGCSLTMEQYGLLGMEPSSCLGGRCRPRAYRSWEFVCEDGRFPIGNTQMVCQSHGVWKSMIDWSVNNGRWTDYGFDVCTQKHH